MLNFAHELVSPLRLVKGGLQGFPGAFSMQCHNYEPLRENHWAGFIVNQGLSFPILFVFLLNFVKLFFCYSCKTVCVMITLMLKKTVNMFYIYFKNHLWGILCPR